MDSNKDHILATMQDHVIRHIPLKEDHRVVDLVTLDELLPTQKLPIQAVVLAGGRGERLHPTVEDLPDSCLDTGP